MNAILDIPINMDGLMVKENGPLALIVPSKDPRLMRASAWSEISPWLRSTVIRSETDEVVSQSFSKFFNYGENLVNDEALERALLDPSSTVYFTEKLDGSTVIRSVIDGEVNFRTRGTLNAGEFLPAILEVVESKYPILLDPKYMNDQSMLFEFISPDYRIVVPYKEPDLVLLAIVALRELRYWDLAATRLLASKHSLTHVEVHDFPKNLPDLISTIESLEGREGVVIRVEDKDQFPDTGGVLLTKLKNSSYLALHRLRFSLTAKSVRELCETDQVTSMDQFEEILAGLGGDFEMMEQVRPMVRLFLDVSSKSYGRALQIKQGVEEALIKYPERKDFAINFAVPLGLESKIAFLIADKRYDQAVVKLRSQMLDQAFESLETKDQ